MAPMCVFSRGGSFVALGLRALHKLGALHKFGALYGQRSLLTFLFLFFLSGCDNGGSSHHGSANTPTVVKTNAVKGIMAGANIALFHIDNGSKGAQITATTSNAEGEFTLRVPASEIGPFLIEATATGETRLRCDVVAGCGTGNAGSADDSNADGLANYGEFYPSPTLTLTAVAATAADLGKLSVTPLTHLATRYAATFPQGWDSLSIALTYSQLSNLFGLETDISALHSFDITDAPSGLTDAQWHYAILNAAFAAVATGGAGDSELGSWLDQVADTFALQNGQLLARHDEGGLFSAEDLAIAARTIAARANPAVDAYFARLLLNLRALPPGALTTARPSPGIGNATLDNVNTFLDDWRTWRDDLPLHGDGTPFTGLQADYQEHLQAQWTLTQILASASQYAPYAAAPDLVLKQYCDTLESTFYRTLCNSLLESKTICLLPLAINGESFCEYLTHWRVPLNNGLIASVDIFAQTAELSGTVDGQVIDLHMVAEQSSTEQITMTINGSIQGERYSWTVMNGTSTFNYDTPLSSSNFQLPDALVADLTLHYSAVGQTGGHVEGDMNAKLDVTLDPWRAIDWESDINTALPQVPMSLEMSGDFTRPYNGSGYVLLQGGSQHLMELGLPYQSENNGLLAHVRLGGTVSQWQSGLLDVKVDWDEHSLEARYRSGQLTLLNAHGIRLLMPEGDDNSGNLYAGEQRYGRLFVDDEVWWIQLGDNTEEPL